CGLGESGLETSYELNQLGQCGDNMASGLVSYLRGKTLVDLIQDGIQNGAGVNLGYNGNDPNPEATARRTTLGAPVGVPGSLMGPLIGGFPVSMDDIKNWYSGVTDPSHWQRALDQLALAKNSISGLQNKITPSGGTPISGSPMTFNDVWK